MFLPQKTVRDAFVEIHAITASTKKPKERYHLGFSAGGGYPINFLDSLAPDANPAVVEAELQELSNKVRIRRVQWVAWDNGKFDGLITRLHQINDNLNRLLERSRYEKLQDSVKSIQAQLVSQEHNPAELTILQTAASTYNHNMAISAQLRRACLASNDEFLRRVSRSVQPVNMLLNKGHLNISSGTASPTYDGQQVVVEWKPYGTSWEPINANQRTERVRALASLLAEAKPEGRRTLHCIGYLDDPPYSRFCLVFRRPLTAPTNIEPHTLLHHITNSHPSLTERLLLARRIANSLFELLVVGWYHKNLRPQNLLFFPTPGDQNSMATIPEPYVIGFEYSRPNQTDVGATEGEAENLDFDIYRHPDQLVHGQPFHQDFDIYSFGLLLVVIALWSNIENIASKMCKIKVSSPGDLWKQMLDDKKCRKRLMREVAFRMGDVYAGVVDKCLLLQTSFASTDSDVRFPFFEKVLKPLEGLIV